MYDSLKSHPLGAPIPDSPHAVSCSLPAMRDVVAYEEKEPQTLSRLQAGYPRFVRHPCIARLLSHAVRTEDSSRLFAIRSPEVFEWLREFLILTLGDEHPAARKEGLSLDVYDGFSLIRSNPETAPHIQKFLQHVGASLSSREAEDLLCRYGAGEVFLEDLEEDFQAAQTRIRKMLAEKHDAQSKEDIYLGNSGMSCFYAAFRALQEIQKEEGRSIWIQLGWLYLDTTELIRKYTKPEDFVLFPEVFDVKKLESFIQNHSERIAGIVTESPTNPLVETPDVISLQDLARRHGLALVLDPTIASPHNIHCLQYADVIVNSLTKYAASEGDVMMGSLALNHKSGFYTRLKAKIPEYLIPPYERDVRRMAREIQNYDAVVERMNANNTALVEMLEAHPKVRRVYHAYSKHSRPVYERLQKKEESAGCMISIVIDGKMAAFYDSIQIAKGPSFGMKYSLLCPFMYLAHYDLVSTEEGRRELLSCGLDPDLIRISVGTEDPDRICKTFFDALAQV